MSQFSSQLSALGFATYTDYLNSDHWRRVKAAYKRAGKSMVCAVCRQKHIQLHHRSYLRLGNENLDDLTPLCRPHHEAVHQWLRESGRIFVEYTHEAVAFLQGNPSQREQEPDKKRRRKSKKEKRAAREAKYKGRHSLGNLYKDPSATPAELNAKLIHSLIVKPLPAPIKYPKIIHVPESQPKPKKLKKPKPPKKKVTASLGLQKPRRSRPVYTKSQSMCTGDWKEFLKKRKQS
jgi:hypothetical protein